MLLFQGQLVIATEGYQGADLDGWAKLKSRGNWGTLVHHKTFWPLWMFVLVKMEIFVSLYNNSSMMAKATYTKING